jgi:hypothetical protein
VKRESLKGVGSEFLPSDGSERTANPWPGGLQKLRFASKGSLDGLINKRGATRHEEKGERENGVPRARSSDFRPPLQPGWPRTC